MIGNATDRLAHMELRMAAAEQKVRDLEEAMGVLAPPKPDPEPAKAGKSQAD